MRIVLSREPVARAAAANLERYGYRAAPVGRAVVTDCPALLAVPVVGRAVGLHEVEAFRFDEAFRFENGAPPIHHTESAGAAA